MVDTRELILARLVAIAAAVDTINLAGRNRTDVTGRRRPAIIVDDGSEQVVDLDAETRGGSKNSGVQRMRMEPSIRILFAGESEDVGPQGNALRIALLAAVFTDATLVDLVGASSSRSTRMQYTGCTLETDDGEERQATMTVNLALTYVFRVTDIMA